MSNDTAIGKDPAGQAHAEDGMESLGHEGLLKLVRILARQAAAEHVAELVTERTDDQEA